MSSSWISSGASVYLPPPKTDQILVARMNSNRYAVLLRQPHGLTHDVRVPGMEATSDVRRGDVVHHVFVVTHRVGAEAFPHVAVEIYPHYVHLPRVWVSGFRFLLMPAV